MKLWILVGAIRGEINDVAVFLWEKDALVAQQKWNKSYSFPEMTGNDVGLFEKEIEKGTGDTIRTLTIVELNSDE